MQRPRLFLFLALILFPLLIQAQSYQVRLHGVDAGNEKLFQILKLPPSFSDGAAAFSAIQGIVPSLQEAGYLTASVDSIALDRDIYDVWVYTGPAYKWARISFTALPPALVTAAGISPPQWEGRPLQPAALSRLTEKILRWCDNNGYPFARTGLDSVQVGPDGGVNGVVALDLGGLRRIDSVVVTGEVRIARNYLMRYLGVGDGALYSEEKLRYITQRLRELPFLQEAAPWRIRFKAYDTRLILDLKERKANQLNALIGLLPNNEATGKFLLTVDALAAFQNILGHGESLSFSYQNLQYRSPRMKADAYWPYLFNTPFGAEGHFDLYKRDTAFSRTSLQLGTRYQITAADYLRLYYHNESNRLIYVDTAYVRRSRQLPENTDASASGAGAELVLNRTDYRLNPRKGGQVRLAGTALVRKVRRNDAITALQDGTAFDYNSLYDSLEQGQNRYQLNGDAAVYLPLGKRATLKIAYAGGWIGGAPLFQNELYQIGGFRLLRGFSEQSLFASQYHVATLELRLLLSRNSNVYLFSDNGWVETRFYNFSRSGLYNGFGAGTTLETKTGLFTIAYALGRSDFAPLQFRQSKIHFGYVAYF